MKQLLTNEALDMMWYRQENTNIDLGWCDMVNNCIVYTEYAYIKLRYLRRAVTPIGHVGLR